MQSFKIILFIFQNKIRSNKQILGKIKREVNGNGLSLAVLPNGDLASGSIDG